MPEIAKKQRRVVGRVGKNGELHILGDVVPFVSTRLGPESISRETEQEHDPEVVVTKRLLRELGGAGQ